MLLKVPYILAILPTSIGKSLAYLLTCSLSISKVTIVIIPLVGLKADILRRAKEYNIPSTIYENSKEFSNLTLVSIETITSPTFISLVQGLINSNSLDRIIIDECHLLISLSSYRSIMFRFKEVLILNTQFVFLTGTLPFSFEKELISMLYLSDLSIIRASCSRPNISYRTSVYKSNKEEERVLEIKEYINNFQSTEFLSTKDKVLIFCPSINNIELVASILNCSKYYSSLSKEEKELTLSNYLNSSEDYYNTLVTSSSLEEGFNYSSIRLVIYKDIAYSFLGFLQGSSRGGRDNKPSSSVFFYNSKDFRLSSLEPSSLNLLISNKALVNQYLQESTCRRRQISLYLDSKLVEQCSSTDNFCDLCSQRLSTTSKQVQSILNSTKASEREREIVKENLTKLINQCLYCSLLLNTEDNSSKLHSPS